MRPSRVWTHQLWYGNADLIEEIDWTVEYLGIVKNFKVFKFVFGIYLSDSLGKIVKNFVYRSAKCLARSKCSILFYRTGYYLYEYLNIIFYLKENANLTIFLGILNYFSSNLGHIRTNLTNLDSDFSQFFA